MDFWVPGFKSIHDVQFSVLHTTERFGYQQLLLLEKALYKDT